MWSSWRKIPQSPVNWEKFWKARAIEKEYRAIVHGHVTAEQGIIDAPLGKDEASIVAIKDCVRPDGALSQTEFWVERRFSRVGERVHIATTCSPHRSQAPDSHSPGPSWSSDCGRQALPAATRICISPLSSIA